MPFVRGAAGGVSNNNAQKTEAKPPWVRKNSAESPIRKVVTPPPSTTTKQPEDVPWRKPNLRKTAVPEPAAVPEPTPKAETKPEWAKAEVRKSSGERVPVKPPPAGKTAEKPAVVKTIPIVQADSKPPEKVLKKPPTSNSNPPGPTPPPTPPNKVDMANGKPPPPPPPPSSGSGPPPPPPPPGMSSKPPVPTKTPEQLAKVEQLRKLSRRRPDPYTLMKEIQAGKKLNHVETNDRSKPIIPRMKSLGKFVFDSEAKPASKTDAIHNKLLDQIQAGIKLKKVTTNDRSKPILGGLRKFRRQNTLEGSEKGGVGTILEETAASPIIPLSDDIDDIDILRDDLQSAKQMLEMEIQGKVQLGKVNQELQCQIITLEAEIEKMKAQLGIIPEDQVSAIVRRNSRAFKDIRKSRSGLYRSSSGIKKSKSGVGDKGPAQPDLEEDALEEVSELEEEINALKGLVQIARASADDWEAKFKEASQKLLLAQGNLEDSEQKRVLLEKKLEISQSRKGVSAVSTIEKTTQTEEQITPERRTSKSSLPKGTSFSYDSGSEEEGSDIEMDEATIQKKKEEREIKLWENKLKSFKEKQNSSQIERKNLKIQQKKLEQELKDQKISHKALQKEVDKMAKALKESAEGSDEEESEEEESEEEEEESEEEESESEESEEEPEPEVSSSEEDDSDNEHEERLALFTKRVKRHENILNALKKGNYLLKANIDRLMDDLEEVKIRYKELEHELNTVLNACS